ncbi:hypothetical protein ACFWXA_04880 [Streptomyces atroolivaceus]|uniref:hypothetical protein n=1 Tax=Streptomyces atroolivaceus TaxID=66869 RepID=UPI003663BE8D
MTDTAAAAATAATAATAVRGSGRPLITVRCVRRRSVLPDVPDGATVLVPAVSGSPGRMSIRAAANRPVAFSRATLPALSLCRTR